MLSEKQLTHISKFLSLVLRHQPELIGIQLDENGWSDVDSLLEKVNNYGLKLDKETLEHVVNTNAKKRFALDKTINRIRANQGHSINIELGYSSQKPPEILFHGTSEQAVSSILQTGLEKRSRHHVHLSSDIETALKVGQRHGKPVVLKILAGQMHRDNVEFYQSDNGVWLTDHVPVKYLTLHIPD
ncbi:RNA 2'-phosphotransferase [Larkinella sp. VNQ87]|uniref:RNA 2'-phosphotransferase n=1 Tax=Larkinella sp. VNQ87 TaxID=3400921 RepID=UPI003C0B6B88